MMIIGLLIKKLPRFQRFTAVWVGIMGSVVLRIIAILFASYLIRFYFFQGIGGLYLMYLAAYELFSDKNPLVQTYQDKNLWKTIAYIIALDLVFSIDSILAAFAVVGISPLDGDTSPKLWIVIAGAFYNESNPVARTKTHTRKLYPYFRDLDRVPVSGRIDFQLFTNRFRNRCHSI
jgi:predicted tellurium resistance membrane protein TerC